MKETTKEGQRGRTIQKNTEVKKLEFQEENCHLYQMSIGFLMKDMQWLEIFLCIS